MAEYRPRTRAGRPRSQQARAAVLRATSELMREVGLRAMTTEDIASQERGEQGNHLQVVAQQVRGGRRGVSVGDGGRVGRSGSGSAREDFRRALRGLIHFYTGETGRAYAQLVGEAQFDPKIGAELRDHLVGARRELVRAIWDRGVARGELRADVDPEVAIDLIFGPAMYRLVAGHAPLDDGAAEAVVDAAIRGLAR